MTARSEMIFMKYCICLKYPTVACDLQKFAENYAFC